MASDDKTKKCRLEFSEKELQIIVESEFSSDKGVDKIPCELLEMDSFSIVFNIKFFIEMIQNITPNDTTDNLVTMFFITPDKAALIKPKAEEEALVMILMPIRMN
jgi:DNA polymerase III sliding clamp (beta) subunit (PCNA family)